jgi:hypothetical protein
MAVAALPDSSNRDTSPGSVDHSRADMAAPSRPDIVGHQRDTDSARHRAVLPDRNRADMVDHNRAVFQDRNRADMVVKLVLGRRSSNNGPTSLAASDFSE